MKSDNFKNLEECKKYFREYRYIRGTLKNYYEYEKFHGLSEQDNSILEYTQNQFLKMSKRVNNFIESINDMYIKQIFCMRYLSGYTWDKISVLFGGVASGDCYRNACNRYFQKYFKDTNRE